MFKLHLVQQHTKNFESMWTPSAVQVQHSSPPQCSRRWLRVWTSADKQSLERFVHGKTMLLWGWFYSRVQTQFAELDTLDLALKL